MSKVKFQNSFKKSMRTKLLVMGTIPVTILALLVCLGATYGIRKAMTEQQVRELEAVAVAVSGGLDVMAPGDFVIDEEDGCLLKGDYDFSDDETILDGFVEGSNCEITLFYNGVSYASTMDNGSGRAIGESVSADISTAIKAGQSVVNTEAVINGVSYVEYFHPVKNSDGVYVGAIFAGVPTTITNHYIGAIVNQIVVVCILVYVISFLCTARSARKINRVITNVKTGVDGIAEGDLNTRFDDKLFEREDELGEMARAAANLRDKLRNIMGTIQQDADLVRKSGLDLDGMANSTSGTTQGINSAVEDIAKGSVTQAEDIEVANAKVEEMGSIIDDILNEIKILDETSRNMSAAGTDSSRIMQELSKTNDETVEVIAEVAANVKATDESVQRISEAVELITSIADQTNLLSLNASIEAARAGEAGKGFAVVATEIQKLSIESNESASHITEAISTLSQDSKKSMEKMESLHGKLEEQQQKLQETLEKFEQVSVGIDSSRENTNVISAQASDCDSARSTMIALVQNLSAISQENAANSEETTASMEELNATMALLANAAEELREMADEMGEATSYFKL